MQDLSWIYVIVRKTILLTQSVILQLDGEKIIILTMILSLQII